MQARRTFVIALALGAAACGKDDKGGAGKASGGSAAAGSAAAGSAAAGSAAGLAAEAEGLIPPVDKVAAQAVIDAWLAAQNGGDFAAYQALYAEKMEGVKRVGARTWRFDRKGWLADRERMFKNKMEVGARDVKIEGSAAAPVVELVQTFKQGKFADEGQKRIVLAKTPAGLRIAREEMVRSVVAGALAGKAGGQLWLPLEVEGKSFAMLDESADDGWGDGKLRGPFDGDYKYALRSAARAPSAASWAARELAVYDDAGKRCPARIGALELIGGGSPHFGELQVWDGIDGGPKWSDAKRARAIYEISGPRLIGELKIEAGCDKPVVVVDAASTAKVFAPAPADSDRDGAAVAAFRRLPAYQSTQKDFVDNYEGKGDWVGAPSVDAFTDGSRTVVVVSAREGDGCGDFYGALTAVFEVTGGKLKALSASDQGYLDVAAVLDVDGDGALELVGDPDDYSVVNALYESKGGGGFVPSKTVDFPFNDCGC
jgi:hypothetical protein